MAGGRPSVLLVRCPDRPGVSARSAGAVADAGGNIANADQHTDPESGLFLQRIEVDDGCDWDRLTRQLDAGALDLGWQWELHHPRTDVSIAVACSRELHCAADLLTRSSIGELGARVVALVSDRDDGDALAASFDLPVHHVSPTDADARDEQLAAALDAANPDLVVLARYMRIVDPSTCERWWGRMINIHHSFLPAFVGARPYHRAHERGVKLIGATAHYVTPDLDAGPIIAQDTVTVTHRDDVADLIAKGRDVERVVLARAVRLHLEHRVLVFGNRTCVFD
jgi:formyltetrahydrofolate deformylase